MLEYPTLVGIFSLFQLNVVDNPELGPLLDITVETAQKVMSTNFFGTVRFVRLIGPLMVKRKKGLIIPVGSTAGELSIPFMGYYSPTKAALHSYTETLGLELKPFGVHVMLCSPGTVISNIANVNLRAFLRSTSRINLLSPVSRTSLNVTRPIYVKTRFTVHLSNS